MACFGIFLQSFMEIEIGRLIFKRGDKKIKYECLVQMIQAVNSWENFSATYPRISIPQSPFYPAYEECEWIWHDRDKNGKIALGGVLFPLSPFSLCVIFPGEGQVHAQT
jgi:hypothetical protein